MTLLQLRYGVALERHGHFPVRPAEACDVTQPALSAGVQTLEAELGAVLFDRTSHPIQPTDLGRRVVARGASSSPRSASRTLSARRRASWPVSSASASSTLAPYLIPLTIAPFARRYPGVELVFEELVADEIIEHVRRDLLDAGIVATAPPGRGIVEVPLFEEPLVGYVARGHRLMGRAEIGVEDLSPDEVWRCRRATATATRCSRSSRAATRPAPTRTPSSSRAATSSAPAIVDRGHGMTLMPWLAVQGQGSHAPESVLPFRAPAPSRTVRLVYATTLVRRHLVRAFAAETARAVASELPLGAILHGLEARPSPS